MRFHSESQRDRYDAVVIGSGIGGLTSAALLARAGLSVLVVERHDRVGGCAHSFRRGRYLFDSAVHIVGGCEPVAYEGGGLVHQLLTALGVRDRVDFERVDPCYEAVFPGLSLRVPGDLDGFVDAHAEHFPREGKGLRLFVQECLNIRQETRRAADFHHAFDLAGSQNRFPTLLRYRRSTLQDVLDETIEEPRLRSLLGTLWPYLGLPPAKVSFVYYAAMLMSYVADGTYYCKGSFQHFSNALADSIRENGGEVLLRSSVRRIEVKEGKARGVVLENGQRISADRVLSNADASQTIHELVGTEAFPQRYLRSLGRMKPSISAFVAYLATDLELDASTTSHETFCFPTWDHSASFASSERGEPSWLSVTAPTLADASLAPDGQHLLLLTTLLRHDSHDWRKDKDAMTRRLVELAEGVHSGLSGRILHCEGATPRTIERYTRNANGALYGWELSPRSTGPGRPATQTPVRGLHLVGHWTQPGGGVYGVVNSGIQVARSVLGLAGEAELWSSLATAEPRRVS